MSYTCLDSFFAAILEFQDTSILLCWDLSLFVLRMAYQSSWKAVMEKFIRKVNDGDLYIMEFKEDAKQEDVWKISVKAKRFEEFSEKDRSEGGCTFFWTHKFLINTQEAVENVEEKVRELIEKLLDFYSPLIGAFACSENDLLSWRLWTLSLFCTWMPDV